MAAVTVPKTNRVYNVLESTEEGLESSINFETRRGSLPWPANSGVVSIPFGKYQIPNTHIWGNSDGITISLPVGASIKSVADGVVSAILDMGGPRQGCIIKGNILNGKVKVIEIK